MKRRRGLHPGFTLLELVLVLVLIAAAMAVVAPNLRGFWAGTQVRETAHHIVQTGRWARAKAISDATVYRLNFDVSTGEYWLTRQEQDQFVELGVEMGRRFTLPQGARMEVQREVVGGADTFIDFRPDGRSEPVTIRIVGGDGREATVVCRSATELMQVLPAGEERWNGAADSR